MNDKFSLDKSYNVFLEGNKRVQVTDGLEKGYIYAAMFFYDEVGKEVKKLEKIVRKHLDAINIETTITDTPILLLELSRRVKAVIGDDSLDAFIKEVLGETQKHICLAPESKEIEKWEAIKGSILTESIATLFKTVIQDPEKDSSGFKQITLADVYVEKLTERQKKLLTPALRMVGFLNELRLDDLEIKDFHVKFRLFAMASPFAAKEEGIKKSLKGLIAGGG